MRKLLAYTALALALASTAAHADMRDYARHGAWVLGRGLNSQHVQMCSVRTAFNDGRSFFLKWQADSGHLFIHIFKNSWRIPAGTEMPLEVVFSSGESLTGTGSAPATLSGRGIEFQVSPDNVDDFLDAFHDADKLEVRFPSGNERPWSINLAATDRATPAFRDCIRMASRGNTQPHGPNVSRPTPSRPSAPSTQPFGNPATPSVPVPARRGERGA